MKSRRTLLAIVTVLLTSLLSGCIVVPLGHHRHRDYRDDRGGHHGYESDRDGRHGRR